MGQSLSATIVNITPFALTQVSTQAEASIGVDARFSVSGTFDRGETQKVELISDNSTLIIQGA
jgi:hypothetical protein